MKLSVYECQREMNMHCNKHLLAPLICLKGMAVIISDRLKKTGSEQ